MGKLDKKVAIITGGGTGIGRTISLMFANEGAKVAVGSRNITSLAEVVKEIKLLRRQSIAIATDVSIKQQVENMVDQTMHEFGRIDILVNNAGILRATGIMDTSEEVWDEVMDINLKGVFLCTQAVAKYMIKQQDGTIINIASISGRGGGLDDGPSYCASKAGVIQLTQNAAFELGPYGINVNCIAPGLIITPMVYGGGRTREEVQAYLEGRKSATVLGRLGEPKDIAKVALFLASEDSSFISGQTIPVDGGRTNRM